MRNSLRIFIAVIFLAACWLFFSGCVYDVPITAGPTRKIDERLLGDWASTDGKDKMKIVRLDASDYVVSYNGDLYRGYHSDVAGTAFVTVQMLDSAKPQYCYLAWKLSDDGKSLTLKTVNDKVVPDEIKDSASVRKLLEKNLLNTNLFNPDAVQFVKQK